MTVPWWVIAVSLPTLGLCFGVSALVHNDIVAFLLLLPAIVAGSAPSGAGYGAIVHLTPPAFRARAFAVYGLVQSVLGLTIGPTAIGLMTDYLFSSPLLIGRSMSVLALGSGGLGTIFILMVRRKYARLAQNPAT